MTREGHARKGESGGAICASSEVSCRQNASIPDLVPSAVSFSFNEAGPSAVGSGGGSKVGSRTCVGPGPLLSPFPGCVGPTDGLMVAGPENGGIGSRPCDGPIPCFIPASVCSGPREGLMAAGPLLKPLSAEAFCGLPLARPDSGQEEHRNFGDDEDPRLPISNGISEVANVKDVSHPPSLEAATPVPLPSSAEGGIAPSAPPCHVSPPPLGREVALRDDVGSDDPTRTPSLRDGSDGLDGGPDFPFSSPSVGNGLAVVPVEGSGPAPLAVFPPQDSEETQDTNWVQDKVMGLGHFLGLSVNGFEKEVSDLFLSIEDEWKAKGDGLSPKLSKKKKLRNELKRLESSVVYEAKDKGKGVVKISDQ